MLRRALPAVRRGFASTHPVSGSNGGAVLPHASDLSGTIAVLPECHRCPSSAATSSSLLSPGISSSAATSPSSSLLLHQVRPRNGRGGFATNSPRFINTNTIPEGPRKSIAPFKCSFSTRSYHDGGHVPEQLQLSTQIDWSLYVHVKEFDCCGRLLCTDSVPLKEFVAKNPMTEKRKIYGNKLGLLDPEKNPVKEEDLFVKDSAKKNAKNLIDGMAEMHGSGVCMVKLDHTNIAVVGGGRLMKYTGLAFVRATLELKQENFEWLKTVLKEDMFEGKPVSHDMDCLFKIMETRAVSSEFLMRNYIAMVPQANKSAFYLRLHEPFKVVKFQNPGRAKLILDSLPHRLTWRQKMRLNHLLEKLFTHGRGYDPADDPWIFALCFKHNCYHKLDRCCDPQTTDQMFDAEEFEDIQESTFPGYVGILEEKMAAELKDAKVDELL